MKFVEIDDLQDLALGAALLGSGGGGCPDYDLLMAEKHLMEYGKVPLVDVASLEDDALVLPIAFAGAPLVSAEMLPSGEECSQLLKAVEELTGRRPTHLMPAEIGGANSLCPFLFAARLKLLVLDADTIGRAFPEMQMSSCNLSKVPANPAFIADSMGNTLILRANDANTMEMIARNAIVAMGSSALVGIYMMEGRVAKQAVIKGSVSLAMGLGRAIREAKERGEEPIKPLIDSYGAAVLGTGVVDQIDQRIEGGFLNGSVSILTKGGTVSIQYQNEYLKAEINGETVALTPEIIALVDSESFMPITSERLLFGTRVTVISLPSPSIWMTEEGLKLVGPGYFGYEDVRCNETCKEFEAI
ncbi:DUF917 domain-containing protein [Estrella lausannensis]|uniref:DUF917 domain-containing protein n=1 Tax=Estrella lausannensis TaxID=483423 RepID=A0A0H5DT47_9BACT|nr:DUF917 domain-containing protein [Estrella lausannensis]CRX39533.1 conserved hypothetical protein [Estrella lausannensis]